MAYRRTERVEQRLRARHAALLTAARQIAAEQGLDAVQIAPVAERAGVAAGTVYRYFESKGALVGLLVADIRQRELDAMRAAADKSPGPISALAAAVVTFAARARRRRRLVWAAIAEPVDAGLAPLQRAFRQALVDAVAERIAVAIAAGHLGDVDAKLLAPTIVGGLLEALLGPLAPPAEPNSASERVTVQASALYALRAAGIPDARARGLVVQAAWPEADDDNAVSAR